MLVTIVIGLSACNPGSSAKAETSAAALEAEEGSTAPAQAAQEAEEGSTAPAQAAQEESTTAEQSAEGKRVYFAAPLFSEAERAYNLKIVSILEKHGYEVFLPQRDGFLAPELEGKTEEEKTTMIFQKDKDEVLKADILFMLLDGRVPDEGACVELGIAYASGKRCYGIKNDARSVELDMDLNPMISGCFTKLFYNLNEEELIKSLEEYLTDNEL
jgi:nucleoside 2-deoxyribosyltransferase